MSNDPEFKTIVQDFYTKLVESQEPLGDNFSKVLHENLWDLMETEPCKCEQLLTEHVSPQKFVELLENIAKNGLVSTKKSILWP